MTADTLAATREAAALETAALLRTWVKGWAASRLLSPPADDGNGWRVEVGLPEQRRRHVFPGMSDALRAIGETTREPWAWIKACVSTDELRAALPPRWTVRAEPSFFMTFHASPPEPTALPRDYVLAIERDAGVHRACIRAADGTLAADGRVAIVDGTAIIDRIGTDAAHRRRGLGRAVMCALHATARSDGVTQGLLVATPAGHALYTTLGWRVQSPYASAVIVGD